MAIKSEISVIETEKQKKKPIMKKELVTAIKRRRRQGNSCDGKVDGR